MTSYQTAFVHSTFSDVKVTSGYSHNVGGLSSSTSTNLTNDLHVVFIIFLPSNPSFLLLALMSFYLPIWFLGEKKCFNILTDGQNVIGQKISF